MEDKNGKTGWLDFLSVKILKIDDWSDEITNRLSSLVLYGARYHKFSNTSENL